VVSKAASSAVHSAGAKRPERSPGKTVLHGFMEVGNESEGLARALQPCGSHQKRLSIVTE
jgi:hypothetical protein